MHSGPKRLFPISFHCDFTAVKPWIHFFFSKHHNPHDTTPFAVVTCSIRSTTFGKSRRLNHCIPTQVSGAIAVWDPQCEYLSNFTARKSSFSGFTRHRAAFIGQPPTLYPDFHYCLLFLQHGLFFFGVGGAREGQHSRLWHHNATEVLTARSQVVSEFRLFAFLKGFTILKCFVTVIT